MLTTNNSLRLQLLKARSREECKQIAFASGFDFTQQELEAFTAQILEEGNAHSQFRDLSEEEVEAVFGGIAALMSVTEVPVQEYGGVSLNEYF